MNGSRIDALWRARERSRLVQVSVVVLVALVLYAWCSGEIAAADLFSARRLANLERFLTVDVRPFELAGGSYSVASHAAWALDIVRERGLAGASATLAIAVLAMVIAAVLGAAFAVVAARNVASRRPFEPIVRVDDRGTSWRVLSGTMRAWLILLRAVPEYVWAYLFLALIGPSAWPAVLALAIHNSGILGKLGAETVENLESKSLFALRALGATRAETVAAGVFPLALSRYLLYVFYRFETCVREATVLGMLGVVSLGYWIQDERTRRHYDRMLLFVCLGAAIVLAADLLSALVRAKLRRGT